MCGIVGLLKTSVTDRQELALLVSRMTATLTHRGPDDGGVWTSNCGRVALGHRRLSIVDLSPAGHQPMSSYSGRFTIAFNGEIYNHRSLRSELVGLGHVFRGESDTEVLLAATEEWGLLATLQRVVGMFAFAVWDEHRHELSLARDRLGEKPLYVRSGADGLAFASESRALMYAAGSAPAVDATSLSLYFRFGYIPEPRSIYEGIRKLAAGTVEVWRDADCSGSVEPIRTRYWSPRSLGRRIATDAAGAVQALDAQLALTISDQMVADVPVGCLLSGGIDSTAVAAVMQRCSDRPIRTFCVSIDKPGYDEGPYARAIAEHIGSEHLEVPIGEEELLALVDDIPKVYDEPFADSSELPMMAVARATRQHVTVALSGDGGDEMFGGYNRYYWPRQLSRAWSTVPSAFRRPLGRAIEISGNRLPSSLIGLAQRLMLGGGPVQDFRGKLTKAGRQLQARSLEAAYVQLICRDLPSAGTISDEQPHDGLLELRTLLKQVDPFEAMTLWDLENYLPGDNLVKVDRASMAVGLEIRAPLLDHRVCDLARDMVRSFGYEAFRKSPKWPLRQVVYKYVPRHLVDRPKMGFSVPLAQWLRRQLKTWGEGLLDASGSDVLPENSRRWLRSTWDEHQRGIADNSQIIWSFLVFLQWTVARERGGPVLPTPAPITPR